MTSRRRIRIPIALLAGGLMAASTLLGGATAGTAQATEPAHWGQYQWNAGQDKGDIRAYWLFDRTGDKATSDVIDAVANAWNESRRTEHPELPFIAVHRDYANAGKCFVTKTSGYSAASACMLPFDVGGARAITTLAGTPHLTGAAFGISPGLTQNEKLTAVCHAIGNVMGIESRDEETSCMTDKPPADTFLWYDDSDTDAVLDLYEHNEPGNPAPVTTTTVAPVTTTTTVAPVTTTTTVAPVTTTTTVAPVTTTTLLPEVTIPEVTPTTSVSG